MRKIVLFISVIFFISCSNQKRNEEDVPSFETEIKDLREINNKLINKFAYDTSKFRNIRIRHYYNWSNR